MDRAVLLIPAHQAVGAIDVCRTFNHFYGDSCDWFERYLLVFAKARRMTKKSKKRSVPNPSSDVKGRQGGFARAKSLSAKRRKEIAKAAADARWGSK